MATLCLSVGHDANGCIYDNDRVISFCLAERVDGLKASSNIYSCIDHIFSTSGYKPIDIDLIIVTGTQDRSFHWSQPMKLRVYGNTPTERGYSNEKDYQEMIYAVNNSSPAEAIKKHFDLLKSQDSSFIRKEKISKRDFHLNPNTLAKEYLPLISPIKGNERLIKQLKSGTVILSQEKISQDFSNIVEGYLYDQKVDCIWLDHHLTHILGSIGRGYGDIGTTYISIDGATGSIEKILNDPRHAGYICERNNNELIFREWTYFCGGLLYLTTKNHLGLQEGKIMGLAPYINTFKESSINEIDLNLTGIRNLIERSLSGEEVANRLKMSGINDFNGKFWKSVSNNISQKRSVKDLDQRVKNSLPEDQKIIISYLIQSIYEILYEFLFKNSLNGIEKVVISGGCALNATANRKIGEKFKEISIELDNACNDEGNSIGCAVLADYMKSSKLRVINNIKNSDIFLGEFPQIPYELPEDITQDFKHILDPNIYKGLIIKQLLSNKTGIAFRGRYESGPRALGNRSLIAMANNREAHYILNKIKDREYWRPIAPMVRDIDFENYFSGIKNKHMIMTNQCITDKLPSVTHIDKTSRVQVIGKEHFLYQYLTEIAVSSEIPPVLCNTSLNGKDQPIFNDIKQVISLTKKHKEITFIILDNGILVKK